MLQAKCTSGACYSSGFVGRMKNFISLCESFDPFAVKKYHPPVLAVD
jgi:hypothetical protein